jgi:hypothetical protein
MQRVPFKEIYCQDCKIILARYNEDYFSESSIDELSKLHYYYHIREGHSIVVRKKTNNPRSLSHPLMSYF